MKSLARISITLILLLAAGLYLRHVTMGLNVVRRAALDIGSGSIKCKVADVDMKQGKIRRIVEEMWRKADYKESMSISPDRVIGDAVGAEGMNIIRDFVTKARQLGADEFAAVGTQSFREAQNGEEYFQRIREGIGIPAVIINQRQQALLGFLATRQHFEISPENLLIWDVGAASMQMVAGTPDGEHEIYLGKMASVGFKNHVITRIQGNSLESRTTPNPLSMDDMHKGLEFVREYARDTVPTQIRNAIRTKGMRIVGIGPVHSICIISQVGKKEGIYTQSEVREALEKRYGMTDSAIGGEFANVQITNLMLVLGFMEALGITEVIPARINMADGLLVAKQLWE